MNGFNYFALLESSDKPDRSFGTGTMVRIGIGLVLVCILVYGIFAFQHYQRTLQLTYLESLETDEALSQQYTAALQINDLMDAAEKEGDFLALLQQYADTETVHGEALLDVIEGCLTSDAGIDRLSVSKDTLTLDGLVKDTASLTTIESNFRHTDCFRSVLINAVESDENQPDHVSFLCQLTLKGGAFAVEEE